MTARHTRFPRSTTARELCSAAERGNLQRTPANLSQVIFLAGERNMPAGTPSGVPYALTRLMQPEEEQRRSLCFWHFRFALILRVRRLSTCNLNSSTSVETGHPQ